MEKKELLKNIVEFLVSVIVVYFVLKEIIWKYLIKGVDGLSWVFIVIAVVVTALLFLWFKEEKK